MIEPTTDELQKKIEKARAELSEETRRAIDAVDWKSAILSIKEKKSYNLEQLQDLETETELLLCGLTNPENYPKELGNRMQISQTEVEKLINELNESIFKKIKDELIKNNKNQENTINEKKDTEILSGAGIEIMPEEIASTPRKDENIEKPSDMLLKVENPELISPAPPIPAQKLSGSFQIPSVKTDYSLKNITPSSSKDTTIPQKTIDPYREIPE